MPNWTTPTAEAATPGVLSHAHALQVEAAKLGFDWPDQQPVWAKLDEEIAELREAAVSGDAAALTHELGDVLFSVLNLARFLGVDAEQAMAQANQRFCSRLEGIQSALDAAGRDWADCSLDELEGFWQQAKLAETKS